MRPGRMAGLLVVGAVGGAILGPPTRAGAADAEAGRQVFAAKQCARCHRPRGEPGPGPALDEIRRPQGEMELAGRLWNHLPGMLVSIAGQGMTWPTIGVGEMEDLMAYLQARAARDPEPDPGRGRMALVRKGCLKCHTLRGEGGPVKPDLAKRRADYESGPAWAATMWQHTPRMEEMARRQGVPYPRFAGDEMADLVGLLRSVAE